MVGIQTDPRFGRYARISTVDEDASGLFGQRNGFDSLLRTDTRRHKIQVKSNPSEAEHVNRYRTDVFVVSPGHLLGDFEAKARDLHEAIAMEQTEVLSGAINRFTQILHTQRATNGRRRVI